MTDPRTDEPRLRQRAFGALQWIAASRILERVLGFGRMLVLARLLAPDDFGAFGIAALAVATLDRVSRPGLGVAIVQRAGEVGRYLDAVWTFMLARSLVIAAILYAVRNPVAAFFESPDAARLMVWVALATAIGGATSLSLQLLQRELDLKRRFRVLAAASIADLLIAVPFAWVTRDAVALAYGMVARNACLVIASWLVHSYKPRPTLDWRPLVDLKDFAVHGAVHSWLYFIVEQGDDALIGKLFGEAALGLYLLAYRLANTLTQELSQVLSEATLPVFSRVQNDPERLATGVRETVGATAALVLPAAGFLAIMAEPVLGALLGSQWLGAVPAFQILLVFGSLRALSLNVESALTALAEVRFVSVMLVVQLAVAATAAVTLGLRFGPPGVAAGVALSQLTSLALGVRHVARALGARRAELLRGLRGPLLGTAGAALPVGALHLVGLGDWADLVAVGGAALVFTPVYLAVALPWIRRDAPTVTELVRGRLGLG